MTPYTHPRWMVTCQVDSSTSHPLTATWSNLSFRITNDRLERLLAYVSRSRVHVEQRKLLTRRWASARAIPRWYIGVDGETGRETGDGQEHRAVRRP